MQPVDLEALLAKATPGWAHPRAPGGYVRQVRNSVEINQAEALVADSLFEEAITQ